MAPKVKKAMKKAKQGNDGATEGAKAKTSPKLSPKMSPKLSPEAVPPKDGTPKAGAREKTSDADKEKLAKEAVQAMVKELSKPDIVAGQARGAWILPGWNEKYKATLGPYKKFCKSQEGPGKLKVVDKGEGNFIVVKHDEKNIPADAEKGQKAKAAGDWKAQLAGAWSAYCAVTPTHERNMDVFTAALPKGVKKIGAEGGGTPKASPKVAPADEAGKKRKADEEADDAPKKKKKAKKP